MLFNKKGLLSVNFVSKTNNFSIYIEKLICFDVNYNKYKAGIMPEKDA